MTLNFNLAQSKHEYFQVAANTILGKFEQDLRENPFNRSWRIHHELPGIVNFCAQRGLSIMNALERVDFPIDVTNDSRQDEINSMFIRVKTLIEEYLDPNCTMSEFYLNLGEKDGYLIVNFEESENKTTNK